MNNLINDIPEKASLLNRTKKALTNWIVENNLVSGTKLPSERDFALKFKVSKITVANALAALEAEGVVGRTPRQGTFVKIALKRPHMVDVYIEKEWKEPILSFDHSHHSYFLFREFLDGIWSASSEFNMSICFEFLDKANPLLSVKRSLFRDGAIFVNTEWPAEFKNMLFEKNIPFAMVASGSSGFKNSVGIRHTGLIKALDELFRLGHRSFGLLAHWTREDYIRDFGEWMRRKHIMSRPEWICDFAEARTDEDSAPLVERYLSQKELPTAIVSTSPIYTRPFFRICDEMGLEIPGDISFLHSGDKHSIACLNRRINLDYPGFFAVAQESVKQLSLLLENKRSVFEEVLVDSAYIPGETFAKLRR